MTEKQKKWAIIGGVIIIALIILLSGKKGATNSVTNQQADLAPINVDIPGFNIPPRGDITITIPPLGAPTPYDFNAVSACMCGGQQLSSSGYDGPLFEIVNNEGDNGPNIYNYAPAQSASPGLYGSWATK